MSEDYKPNCRDALAWKEVDQLHEATLQISKQCFEYKKLCIAFTGVSYSLILTISNDNLVDALFVMGILISVGFWIADSIAYYFQRKVRSVIDHRMNYIAINNSYDETRTITSVSWKASFLNLSMSLYYIFILLSALGWLCFSNGWIEL